MHTMRKKICVILCTYNGEKYLRPQIDSILSQSTGGGLAAHFDMALHVFDDCSCDATRAILEEYKSAHPDDVYLHLRDVPSGGACLSFLDAVRRAPDADLYMLSDQDDIWNANKAASLLDVFLGCGNACTDADKPMLAFSDARVTDDKGIISGSFVNYQKLSPRRTSLNHLLVMNQITGAACMFNRSLRSLILSAPPALHAVMHDHLIALTASAFGDIVYLDRALYSYRQHGTNVLGAQSGAMLLEIRKRLGLAGRSREEMDQASRSSYDALFAQAEEFMAMYAGRFSPAQLRMLRAFISLKDMSRAGKIAVILRYGFTFNRFHRTIGELIFL